MADKSTTPIVADVGHVLCKVEANYGVDPVPVVATDYVLAQNIEIDPNVQLETILPIRHVAGAKAVAVGSKFIRHKAEFPITGAGADGAPATLVPTFDAYLKAGAWKRGDTGAPVDTLTWTPATLAGISATAYLLLASADGSGMQWISEGLGAKTAWVLDTAKGYGVLEVEAWGLFNYPTTVAPIAVTDGYTTPLGISTMAAQIAGDTYAVKSLRIENVTDVTPEPSVAHGATTFGIAHCRAMRQRVTWQAVINYTKVADTEWYALQGTNAAITAAINVGGAQGTVWNFAVAGIIAGIKLGTSGRWKTATIEGESYPTAVGDDECSVILT